jgi:membrane protease YdiL (CAAX protease family)
VFLTALLIPFGMESNKTAFTTSKDTLNMPYRYWLFVTLTLSMTTVVGIATYRTGQLLKEWTPDTNLLLLHSENIVRGGMIVSCVLLGLLSGLHLEQLGWTTAMWPSTLIEGTIWGFAMATAFYLFTQWVSDRSGEKVYSSVVVDAILPRSTKEFLWTILAMAGVVVAEELLFRSLLLGGLEPILPQATLLIVTSLLFGFFHLPQGAWGVAGAAIAGGILGLIFIRTGTIVAPIAAHYVTNMAQIWVAMRARDADALSNG